MTQNVEEFDYWIRHDFIEINTELEEIYFAQEVRDDVSSVGTSLKKQLTDEAHNHIEKLLAEGNTDSGFDSAYQLLGNVGFYMAACRRHDLTEPSREKVSPLKEASALALHLGASLGLTPRFATSHLTTHNFAVKGKYKSFTSLHDEYLFIDNNTRSIFAYKRAADALVHILPLGISHPVSYDLLIDAKNALRDVKKWNAQLYKELDTDRFFYSVRPYYKPYRVGLHEYRGANAGDFAGINEIDMLLGLCPANHQDYSQLLVDKFLYMMPEDQLRLRDCMRRRSIMDLFLDHVDSSKNETWFTKNLGIFIEVCELHGKTASQHHDQLVKKYIEKPAHNVDHEKLKHITASGPPLQVLLSSLEKLRDLRCAKKRDDIPSRYNDITYLKGLL